MLWIGVLVALHAPLHAEPWRCVATWVEPVPGCAVPGPLMADATANSEVAARRAATAWLGQVLEDAGEAKRVRYPLVPASDYGSCEEEAKGAMLNCFPEPALAETKLCYVVFTDPCWSGQPMTLEITGWRALAEGRELMCGSVDARLVAQDWSNLEQRRADCRAQCEQKVQVRCP